jgi:uncharacterized protein (TIGR02996 family)
MTDEPALLAAIAARPDDDTPRLVYADWLDDHGDADRAEFIRLQCALAQGGPDDPAAAERADELENRHRIRWLAGVPTGPGLRWEFRRGFPERLEADIRTVLARFAKLSEVPWLRDLCVTNVFSSDVRDFVSRPWPERWVELEVCRSVDPAGRIYADDLWSVGVVAASPQSAQLRSLRLSGFELSTEGVAALAESPHLVGLQLLSVPGDRNRPRYAPLRARFGRRLVGEGA